MLKNSLKRNREYESEVLADIPAKRKLISLFSKSTNFFIDPRQFQTCDISDIPLEHFSLSMQQTLCDNSNDIKMELSILFKTKADNDCSISSSSYSLKQSENSHFIIEVKFL